MSEQDIKALQKDMNVKKRLATEWASQIHDLVEDRLWSDYHNLPELAEQAVKACEEWKLAKKRYEQAGE
jgi:hypothetical protein